MLPDYKYKNIKLFNRNCDEVFPIIQREATAIISDPPYGCKNDCNYTRFSGGKKPSNNFNGRDWKQNEWAGIKGDDQPFDPSPWLTFPKCVLFGYQYFANQLPIGSTLVWVKKRPNQLGKFLSDAELAWMKSGKGVYVFNHIWHGFDRESERGPTQHPTQKPVALMTWVMGKAKVKQSDVVADPYMGAGSMALACLELGLPFIGVEIEPTYFGRAVARIEAIKNE